MRTARAFFSSVILASALAAPTAGQDKATPSPATPSAESTDTHLTIHNIPMAHSITLGNGSRVGILDRSFDVEAHPGLYSGGKTFLMGEPSPADQEETHHGYWMALALNEIAPKAEIYALEVPAQNEVTRVAAMVRALDWAVAHGLDVVTYCTGPFSEGERRVLDPAVERTVKAGVVVVFVNYDHPINLLPAGFGPPGIVGLRDPDLNIFSYDCTTFIADNFIALMNPDDDGIRSQRPFLGGPSAGPVTAGFVALLRSVDPYASPAEIKKILRNTSRPMAYRGRLAARVPDAFGALTRSVGASPEVTRGSFD